MTGYGLSNYNSHLVTSFKSGFKLEKLLHFAVCIVIISLIS